MREQPSPAAEMQAAELVTQAIAAAAGRRASASYKLAVAPELLLRTLRRTREEADNEDRFYAQRRAVCVEAPGTVSLLTLLRDYCRLTGTKRGCDIGECGACTVLLDDRAVTSCMVMAGQVQGRRVVTIEGLTGHDGALSPLQQAFVDHFAVQCGFCTPGMIMSATALLHEDPHPSREKIRRAISGNLCRCTGYDAIVDAIDAAAAEMARLV